MKIKSYISKNIVKFFNFIGHKKIALQKTLNKAAARNKNAVSGTLLIFTFFQILIVLEKLYLVVFLDFQNSLWFKCFLFCGKVFSKYFEMYLNTLLKYLYFLVLPKSYLYLNNF